MPANIPEKNESRKHIPGFEREKYNILFIKWNKINILALEMGDIYFFQFFFCNI